MKKKVLIVLIIMTIIFGSIAPVVVQAQENERFVTITLHAGENGYFETPDETEKESVQFRGEAFQERTIPNNTNPEMIFLGWAKTPDADSPDVFVGMTNAGMIGTDLYAVWSKYCYVTYNAGNAYIEIDGQQENKVRMQYENGEKFRSLTPVHFGGDMFIFNGWYKSASNGEKITIDENTVIDQPEIDVRSNWKFNPDKIDKINLNEVYHMEVSGPGEFYSFTPEETSVYELYTQNSDDMYTYSIILLMDEDLNLVKSSDKLDNFGNTQLTCTLEKGVTYYIEFQETGGSYKEFDGGIRNAEYKTVTFHTGRESQNDVWFGDDESCKEIEVPFAIGEEIHLYNKTGLQVRNTDELAMSGWSVEQNQMGVVQDKIYVEDDMDVYAVYFELDSLILDANGGYFPLNNNADTLEYVFAKGSTFDPPYEPHLDDNRYKIAGWSRDPNATEPDEDILELITLNEDLPERLYAVYSDKVLEVFDANGGYLLDDPSVTTYEATKGVGHIFYGLALFNSNKRMVPLGWEDHKGELIPYTPNAYPYYHVEEDTTYKAIWGYEVFIDSNGGYFPEIGTRALKAIMEYEGAFNLENLKDQIGECINYDNSKYLAGWATTPDATEPDIIEGQTPVKDLDWVYAVWKDATYYYEKGKNSTWEKDSKDGLEFIIKRNTEDEETIHAFTGVMVDGEAITAENFEAKEGSLILTLKPEYLNTLEVGKHELTVHFGQIDATTSFTITQKEEEKESNPITGDDVILFIPIVVISAIGFVYTKKRLINE